MQNNAYTNHAVGPDGSWMDNNPVLPPHGGTTSPVQPRLPQPEDFIASRPPIGSGGTSFNPTNVQIPEFIRGLLGSGGQGKIADFLGGQQPKQEPKQEAIQVAPKLYPSRDIDIKALSESILRGPAGNTTGTMPPVSAKINKMQELSRAMGSNDYANPFQSFRKNISAVTQKMANLDLGEEYMSRIFGGQKPEQFFNNVTNVFGQTWGELGNRMTALETLSKKRGG